MIVGHTRLLAAKRLGLAQVPVHVAADLSPAQARAYRLADNRTAEETTWDPELLPAEIAALLRASTTTSTCPASTPTSSPACWASAGWAADRSRRGARAARRARHASPATSGSWASIACSAATHRCRRR